MSSLIYKTSVIVAAVHQFRHNVNIDSFSYLYQLLIRWSSLNPSSDFLGCIVVFHNHNVAILSYRSLLECVNFWRINYNTSSTKWLQSVVTIMRRLYSSYPCVLILSRFFSPVSAKDGKQLEQIPYYVRRQSSVDYEKRSSQHV